MNVDEIEVVAGFFDGLKPEPRLTVSEWADQFRVLAATSTAEPGRWRTSRTPHMQEIMDDLSATSNVEEVVFMKAAQIAATESGFNWMGYIIDVAPAPTLMVQPTDGMIKRMSKSRFDPMIEATPRLRAKIKTTRARDSGNTITQKDFPGGTIVLTGANSPVGLRSMPAKNVFLDEVDAYPLDLDGEGSPIDLAKARTRTFSKKKIFITSTPTVKGKSIIEAQFETTDQRYRFVPCPACEFFQVLVIDHLIWEPGKYDTARYKCVHCDHLIEERHKTRMFARAEWRPTKPENLNPRRKGYHLNSLYSPFGWYSWREIAEFFERAEKDNIAKKALANTVLGLTWEEDGDVPPWENIYNRRETYPMGWVAPEVAFITAGVDIQKDRIEIEIVGWCRGKISYSIDYRVLLGETNQEEVWHKLTAVLNEQFTRTDGMSLPIRTMAIDTGYNTSFVYDYCKKYVGRCFPVKGQDAQNVIISQPKAVDVLKSGKKVGRTKVWNVGVSLLKSELYAWLRLNKNEDGTIPDGYCHFPQYDSTYFRGITAEQIEFKIVRGHRKFEWVKKYERNEPLDCRIYSRAAASIFGMDRFTDDSWAESAGSYVASKPAKDDKKRGNGKKSSFWDR